MIALRSDIFTFCGYIVHSFEVMLLWLFLMGFALCKMYRRVSVHQIVFV